MCNRQFIECARIPVEFVARLLRYACQVLLSQVSAFKSPYSLGLRSLPRKRFQGSSFFIPYKRLRGRLRFMRSQSIMFSCTSMQSFNIRPDLTLVLGIYHDFGRSMNYIRYDAMSFECRFKTQSLCKCDLQFFNIRREYF